MGLNKNSLREGQTSGAFWGLLHAYDLKSELRKCLAHMCGEVWSRFTPGQLRQVVNPHARGIFVSCGETKVIFRIKTHMKVEMCG